MTKTKNVIFKPVISSQIKEVGYDKDTKTLYVRFKNNDKVYSYMPIEAEIYDEMLVAKSIGKFFHAYVKKNVKGKLENPEQF